MNCQLQLFQNNLGYKENAGISIDLGGKGIKDIFVKINEERTFDFQNDYHLKDDAVGKGAGSDGTDVGIYGGNGFNEMGTPPYPYVIFKKVPNETDAQGNLKIKVKVMTL